MKSYLNISLIVFSGPLVLAQELDVDGHARVTGMNQVNTADSVVVWLEDGTMAYRDVSSLIELSVSLTGDTLYLGNKWVIVPGVSVANFPPASPEPSSIIITEIMINPGAVEDVDGEWFEVYNTTLDPIDMNGMTISDLDGESHTINHGGPLVIYPGEYLILGRSLDIIANGGVSVDYAYAGFTLANIEDEVQLYLGAILIDAVAYASGFPISAGASMNLDPDHLNATDNDSAAFWCLSQSPFGAGDLGTPGTTNDDCP